MWAVERAAVLLGHTANPLFFWLDLLKQESPRYSGGGTSETIVGDQVSKAETGTISTLCLASAEYCYRLETQAIAKDRNKWVTVEESVGLPQPREMMSVITEQRRMRFYDTFTNSPENRAQREFEYKSRLKKLEEAAFQPPTSAPPKVGSIGEQLEQLRQECNWSIEKLAEAVKIDPTNVSRHLSNKSVPYPRNLAKYIHVLSKELKRHIVISKTQPRRS
jgi:ribosome-binding protein aMBF1 (putative translation factor)